MLKLAETATTCDDCSFTFVEPSAEVTGERNVWVVDENTMKLEVDGTGLCSTSDPQAVLTIEGQQQELLSCDDSQAVYKLAVTKRKANGFDLLLGDGYPKGHPIILKKSVYFNFYVTEISPLEGSVAGQRLTIKGFGFGLDYNGDNITIEKQVDGEWSTLCDGVDIIDTGVATCLTQPGNFKANQIRARTATRTFGVAKNEGARIRYKQKPEQTPTVTSAVIEGVPANQIRFTGSGFKTAVADNLVVEGHYRGQVASQVTYTDTEAVVQFVSGIPMTLEDDDEVPTLHFVDGNLYEAIAENDDNLTFAAPATI